MKGGWLCIARFFLRSIIPSKGHLALNCTVFFGRISFLCDSDLEPHESRLKATFSEILISLKCTKLDKNENQWGPDLSFRFHTRMVQNEGSLATTNSFGICTKLNKNENQ